MKKLKGFTVCLIISALYLINWFTGIVLLLIDNLLYHISRDNYLDFFWNVVEPYNRISLLISIIPVVPIVAFICIIVDLVKKQPLGALLSFAMCVITNISWMVYVCLFVFLTGGV